MKLTGKVKSILHSIFFGVLTLISQLSPQSIRGQEQQADNAPTSCVSPEMARLIVQERDGIRVHLFRENQNETSVQENAKGVSAATRPATPQTIKEARKWFRKAARRGYPAAQVNLAVLSLAGWGTRPNAGTALYWLHAAAQQGYAPALFDLGIVYMEGCGVGRDYGLALQFFQKGALTGYSAAQMNLGYLYDRGLGVGQDRTEAAKWYRLAADSGEARAQYNLADLYLRGEGVPQDDAAAFAWFQKAAAGGHAEARIMLGSMYITGRGTLVDPAAAYMWLSAAAMQGDSRASARLDALKSQLSAAQLSDATARATALVQSARFPLQQALFH
jgi:TPR repeat protein